MTAGTGSARWLRRYRPRAPARLRIVCLPHAGGAASWFRTWSAHVPEDVEVLAVQYPGRQDRLAEAPLQDMASLAAGIVDALVTELDGDRDGELALFGHSMGAFVAYEVARMLDPATPGFPHLRRLVVSGQRAPTDHRGGSVHLGDDDTLVAEVRRLGGTHHELLDDQEVRSVLLPTVRGDYRVTETYRHLPGRRLTCPVSVFLGEDDPEVDAEQARAWQHLTSGGFDLRQFPGGHFYLADREAQVVDAVLTRTGRPAAPVRAWPSPP